MACVARWQARYPGECLLLVSHAGVLRTLLCHWLALPLAEVMRVPQHYACRILLPEKEFWGEGTSFSWR
ncbi:MAG: histidine phosphatase family protein [Desulfovibrio sp.]|nr:histidine phosphatase family protein [Desulfovibrio sp.]